MGTGYCVAHNLISKESENELKAMIKGIIADAKEALQLAIKEADTTKVVKKSFPLDRLISSFTK
jgi:hypothetical protein